MDVQEQIKAYLESLPGPKQGEMQTLHDLILQRFPGCKLWFLDGLNSEGKVVSNPNIGYGWYTVRYADGSSKEFFRIGLSANKTGISVYVLGLADKTYLSNTFGRSLGKASVTAYCIRFKTLQDIHVDVLLAAIRSGFEAPDGGLS